MEAVGTAASIIQLASFGLKLAKTLYSLCDEGASGSEQVKELFFYVRSTSIALEEVGKIFEEESRASKPLISQNAITTANDVIFRCTEVFNKLGRMAEDGLKSTFGLLTFPLKSSRLQMLQTKLEQSKIDLQLMMQVILNARLKAEPSNIVNELEQRKVITKLIDERIAVYTREHQVNQMLESSPKCDPHRSSSSSLPSNSALQNATNRPQSSHAFNPGELQPPKDRSPPTNESGQSKNRSYSGVAHPSNPGEADVSYCSALYLVCCPCLRRKRGLQTESSRPLANIAPRLSIHMGRTEPDITSPPFPTEDAPLSIPKARRIPLSFKKSDAQNKKDRTREEKERKIAQKEREKHKMVLRKEQEAKVPSTHSPDEDTHGLELDRLLHQWTTIYDPPSIAIEEGSLSMSQRS